MLWNQTPSSIRMKRFNMMTRTSIFVMITALFTIVMVDETKNMATGWMMINPAASTSTTTRTTTRSSFQRKTLSATTTIKDFAVFRNTRRHHSTTMGIIQLYSTTYSSSSTSSGNSGDEMMEEIIVPNGGGLFKTIVQPGMGEKVKLGDIATVQYSCYLLPSSTSSSGTSAVTILARSTKQRVIVGDTSMIDGWDKAIRSMKVGEQSIFQIQNPLLAYGNNGIPPIIPPNAGIEIHIEMMDSIPPTTNIDFDQIALATNKIPTTPNDIAIAYEQKQLAKSLLPPPKEGIEGWIEKIKTFYFFGLFDSETGERPPWFLRPSITFPLAIAILGVTFYIAFASGAIYERGIPTTDELDEFIVATTTTTSNNMY